MAKKPSRITWAQACRDIMISAITRGQLIPLGLLAFLLLAAARVPPEHIAPIAEQVLNHFLMPCGISLALVLLMAGLWFVHARYLRKAFHDELNRIGKEKTALQAALAGTKYKSSKAPWAQ